MVENDQLIERGRCRVADLGASLIEYVLMISLIALVCLSAVSYFGGQTDGGLQNSADSIVNAGN